MIQGILIGEEIFFAVYALFILFTIVGCVIWAKQIGSFLDWQMAPPAVLIFGSLLFLFIGLLPHAMGLITIAALIVFMKLRRDRYFRLNPGPSDNPG